MGYSCTFVVGIHGYSWAFMFLCVPRSVRTRLFRAGFLVKWSHRAVCGETEMSSELSSIIILLVLEEMWAQGDGHRVHQRMHRF